MVQKHENGSAMVVALLVLVIVCLLGSTILTVTAIESKTAAAENKKELVRHAADGGLAVARNIIMNYLAAGEPIPHIEDVYLDNGCRAAISCDFSHINDNGVVKITSRGYWEDDNGNVIATKAVVADLLVDYLSPYAVRADTLKAAGVYYATISGKEIDLCGNQDWDAAAGEPRLEDDPSSPDLYPLHGKSYDSFDTYFQYNHPEFDVQSQQWQELYDPDYTWWVNYEYESSTHDLEKSSLSMAPFYRPFGYLEVVNSEGEPEKIGLKTGWSNEITADELSIFFEDTLSTPSWGSYLTEEWYQSEIIKSLRASGISVNYYPDKIFRSQDFIRCGQVIEDTRVLDLTPELLKIYPDIARLNKTWEYIPADSSKLRLNSGEYELDVDQLEQTYVYINRPAGDTIVLDFNELLSSTGNQLGEWLEGNISSFFSLIKNENRFVVLTSNADLKIILDSVMFEQLNNNSRFYIISGGTINIYMTPAALDFPNSPRNVKAFMLAGEDINIYSDLTQCSYTGIINAGEQLYICMKGEGLWSTAEEHCFRIEKDSTIVSQFPEEGAYIGIAPVVNYSYID